MGAISGGRGGSRSLKTEPYTRPGSARDQTDRGAGLGSARKRIQGVFVVLHSEGVGIRRCTFIQAYSCESVNDCQEILVLFTIIHKELAQLSDDVISVTHLL